jgi:hypothetical protein
VSLPGRDAEAAEYAGQVERRCGRSPGFRHSSTNVVCDEDGAVGAGCRCDQDVVRSDRRSRAIELLAKEAVLTGAAVVEGKARDRVEESLQQAQVLSDPIAFPRDVRSSALTGDSRLLRRRKGRSSL